MRKKESLLQKINGLIRKARVPKYIHHFGPKTYTSRQHVKSWLLKEKLGCSWEEFLEDHAQYYGIRSNPDSSTLKKFVKRMPFWLKNKLVALSTDIEEANYGAIDSTGLSRTNASQHYTKRIDRDKPIKKMLCISLNKALSFLLSHVWIRDTMQTGFMSISGSRDYAALSLLRKAVRGEDTGKR